MADSYRLTVLKRLTAHLRGITRANGYDYDLIEPRSVCRGRLLFGDDDPLPLLSILEGTRGDIGSFAGHGERKEHWPLTIQGWVADDVDNPTDPAYGLLDAVERHMQRLIKVSSVNGVELYPDEYLLGRSVADIQVSPGIVRPPMEGVSSRAFFYLPVRVTLVNQTD